MTIYLDVVFFINLLYQLGILQITNMLFKLRGSFGRMLAASALGSACYCLCIILKLPVMRFPANLTTGMAIGIISVFAAFYPMGIKKLWEALLTELLLSACLSGILDLFGKSAKGRYLMLTASAALIFLGLFCIKVKRLLLERFSEEKSIRRVRLCHKGRFADAYGLIDTGNGLKDPLSGESVIIIQKSIAEKLLLKEEIEKQKGYRVIPYGSIGKKRGILEAFRLEWLEIEGKSEDGRDEAIVRDRVLCAVYEENYNNGAYEVILSPLLL